MENRPLRHNIQFGWLKSEYLPEHCSFNPWENTQQDVIDEYGDVQFRGWWVGGYDLGGQGRHGLYVLIFRLDKPQKTIGELRWGDESYRQPGGVYEVYDVSNYHEDRHGTRPRTSLWIYCKVVEPTPENRARKALMLKNVEEYGMLPPDAEHGFLGGPLVQEIQKNWGKTKRTRKRSGSAKRKTRRV